MEKTPKLSPRQQRAVNGLRTGWMMREQLDRHVGCSNSPELISQLRKLGLTIPCTKVSVVDRDGLACKSGRYELTPADIEMLDQWEAVCV